MSKIGPRIKELRQDIMDGVRPANAMPLRVFDDIRRREALAERLIGWTQLTAVVFFAALYALAPRALGASGFNFVPFALAGYLVFTLIRLWASYRFVLPGWFLFLSIVIDVALLFAIIFSFHIQYDQHPTFYLKAPTLLYIFILIALRALRFDPRFVLATGAVAALGWLSMLSYAILSDMGGMKVTRNYVDYLTSDAILIGAELDKMIAIIGVSIILAIVLLRARALLFSAVRDHTAAQDLKRFFAPEVARSITDADKELSVGQGIERDAAVMVVDIRSFTVNTEKLTPNATMRLLARYQAAIVPAIQKHGGRVDKFMGDGVLATFGAVEPSETYAADALRAVPDVLAVIDDCRDGFCEDGWPGTLRIGCAVTCGTVTVGVVGVADRLEYTVIGDPVNLAVKLENLNKPEATRALSTGGCLQLAKQQGYNDGNAITIRARHPVVGVDQAVDLAIIA